MSRWCSPPQMVASRRGTDARKRVGASSSGVNWSVGFVRMWTYPRYAKCGMLRRGAGDAAVFGMFSDNPRHEVTSRTKTMMRATADRAVREQPTFETSVEDVRRTELRAFVRSRRERLTPADVGLIPGLGRRRTPGLRREEVAELAGVGVTWYTWFEMGRDIHVSAKTLEAIARALRLGAVETEHLHILASSTETLATGTARPSPSSLALHPAIEHVLRNSPDAAIIAYDAFLTALRWNDGGDAVFDFSRAQNEAERNLLWRLFRMPGRKERWPDLETVMTAVLGQFRRTYARYPDAPLARTTIADLWPLDDFRQRWKTYDLVSLPEMTAALPSRPIPMKHPDVGTINLYSAFLPLAQDGFLNTMSPADPESTQRFQRLLA